MKLAPSRELFAYWNSLRGARRAPERAEIDPIAISGLLADTFILEIDPRAGYPFRVAGDRTGSLFQCELRGRPFLDIWQVSARNEIVEMLKTVTDEASPVVAGVAAQTVGFHPLELELLVLPLRHRGATHSRVLGLCSPASSPTWLGLAPVGPMALHSMRVLRQGDDRVGPAAARAGAAVPSQLESLARLMRRGQLHFFSSADPRP
ncbi:MAG TPA: PAS domain-containing protein [Roseiarcus sp.]|nr:PAS domain-containing protein [Roseiarcus sp.]